MKHAKTHAEPQLSEGDRTFFKLLEAYRENGGDFGEEAKEGFRRALAERLKNPPELNRKETIEFYRAGVLNILREIKKPKHSRKK